MLAATRLRVGALVSFLPGLCICLCVCLGLSACVSKGRPPVADRSPVANPKAASYVVRAGDTLYSIAWRHDRDFRQLAALNSIAAPFQIVPGQRLRLTGTPPSVAPKPLPAPKPNAPQTANRTAPPQEATPKTASNDASGPLRWRWPVQAEATKTFGAGGNKGIDFGLAGATHIQAAAAGEIVYAGAGLGGYRYLVIVKHSERYLSAYGFDALLRVLEGEQIKVGGILADIPSESAVQSLHFELRKDGVPINPTGVIGR